MKRLFGAMCLCVLAPAAPAAEIARDLSWASLRQQGALLAGELRPADSSAAFEHLEVKNPKPDPRTLNLLKLETPSISKSRYAIVGNVRYEGVEGTGYLEMWSTFAQKGRFFTRTLAPSGPMQSLIGSSPWRPFALPFDATGATAPPQTLLVNLFLPGRGTVHVGPLRLVEYTEDVPPGSAGGAWWGPRTAGRAGGVVGSLVGCLGGVIGLLAGRGRGRALAMGLVKGMLGLGAISLVFGVVALFRSQPYAVFYPLLLGGVLGVGLPLFLIPTLRRRYAELELRKMKARDLSAGHPA